MVLHWILRGDHQKWIGQRMRMTVDRDLALVHRLQQRRLRLRRRAVDLVSEQNIGEDGPALELEALLYV